MVGWFNCKIAEKIRHEGEACREIRIQAESERRRLNEEQLTSVSHLLTALTIHTEVMRVFISSSNTQLGFCLLFCPNRGQSEKYKMCSVYLELLEKERL